MIHMQIGRGGSDLFQVVCTDVGVQSDSRTPLGSVQSVWMVFRISVNESRYGKEAHDGQFVS